MDALAVAIATGIVLGEVSGRQTFRLAFHFGLFQFLMPVVGYLAGMTVERRIKEFDHWVAFALLGFIGGKMVCEGFRGGGEEGNGGKDPTRGMSLVMLSVATSIDALSGSWRAPSPPRGRTWGSGWASLSADGWRWSAGSS